MEKKEIKPLETDDCCAPADAKTAATHPGGDDHEHSHDHAHGVQESLLQSRWPLWVSLLLLLGYLGATSPYVFNLTLGQPVGLSILGIAYVLAGYKTIERAFRSVRRGDFFNEFTLMTSATFGAFYIGEYSEGVAVMLFYEIGELIQDLAVNRSKRSIKALLDVRPTAVTVLRNGQPQRTNPVGVTIGETIQIKPGEQVALDGTLLTDSAPFNTAALTGEAKPDTKRQGESVLAGMIALDRAAELRVTAAFRDSKLARILELTQQATARKAPTQLLISRLARVYTPIVFGLALSIALVPYFLFENYIFNDWLYRGLVFLVIACPCALTVSIPLGYFGGIGLASRNGILVKGSNFLDVLTQIDTLVSDKTGTLTKGVFRVQQLETHLDQTEFSRLAASLESQSTHPVARAVVTHAGPLPLVQPTGVQEFSGQGLRGNVAGKSVLCGNLNLLRRFGVTFPPELENRSETLVVVAIDEAYAGYFAIADEVKEDAAQAVADLRAMGIETILLSGDKVAVVESVARQLGITQAHGELLPEDKVDKVQALKNQGRKLAFVGDGINDAPVIALADVGIAMGGLGSDAAIETADIVIQNDQPSRLVSAIRIGRMTRAAVWQNITLAMGVKVAVMALGAGGIATLWEAVFADVGVALLAILNAYRIQGRKLRA
ncbi:MAG: cadmium-translocating P-type ATPase [Cytophagaceae bacterium]|nr:cadmium-translocating P-type ATPase [Cytophagaceae bacterium]